MAAGMEGFEGFPFLVSAGPTGLFVEGNALLCDLMHTLSLHPSSLCSESVFLLNVEFA